MVQLRLGWCIFREIVSSAGDDLFNSNGEREGKRWERKSETKAVFKGKRKCYKLDQYFLHLLLHLLLSPCLLKQWQTIAPISHALRAQMSHLTERPTQIGWKNSDWLILPRTHTTQAQLLYFPGVRGMKTPTHIDIGLVFFFLNGDIGLVLQLFSRLTGFFSQVTF
jgi:hypothetical protein